jgi:hypothetical protein
MLPMRRVNANLAPADEMPVFRGCEGLVSSFLRSRASQHAVHATVSCWESYREEPRMLSRGA